MTTFEAFRTVTGWQRPSKDHGCKPVEVIPGVWTAHYHDIDSKEKLAAATKGAPIRLVVNSALCQCEARTGFYGEGVRVLEVDLEDDPEERKGYDAGKPGCQSKCADPTVELKNRCAGDILPLLGPVSDEIDAVLTQGGHVLVHCHASLSRSAAFVLAYIMRTRRVSLLAATQLMKTKWNATWPCDRFSYALVEHEKLQTAPYRLSRKSLAAALVGAAALGATMALLARAAIHRRR